MNDFKIGCIQIASGPKVKANLLEVSKYISQAKNEGAKLSFLCGATYVEIIDEVVHDLLKTDNLICCSTWHILLIVLRLVMFLATLNN